MITTLELNLDCVSKVLNFLASGEEFLKKRNTKELEQKRELQENLKILKDESYNLSNNIKLLKKNTKEYKEKERVINCNKIKINQIKSQIKIINQNAEGLSIDLRLQRAFNKLLSCTAIKLGNVDTSKILDFVFPEKKSILKKSYIKLWLDGIEKVRLKYCEISHELSLVFLRFDKTFQKNLERKICIGGVLNQAAKLEIQRKEEEGTLKKKYGAIQRTFINLSKPPVEYNKMNDFVVYGNILDFITGQGVYRYSWKVNDINQLIQKNHSKWIENAEHRLQEYKNLMESFFSDDLHKELIDDAFIAEIRGIEERLIQEQGNYIKTVNECFNRLKNETEEIFSNEVLRLEFSMRLFYSFYSHWIKQSTRIRLNDFKSDVSNIKEMINSFDINLFTNEQIFDIWDKMQELLKVKKKKTDIYTDEQRLEKTKELMDLNAEYQKYSKYTLGYDLLSLIEKNDVEIDNEIAGADERIEQKKQEKLLEEEFELKASVVVGVDLKTKEPKQYKVAVGMYVLLMYEKTSYNGFNYFNYVIIDIDTVENKIQVMNEEQSQLWLDCKTIHDIEIYPLSFDSCYRIKRNKILGDLLPYFTEQAESKGLYVIK